MSEKLNQKIIDKIDGSDEEKWVKDFAKRVLRFERSNYTGRGGDGYKDNYKRLADKMRGE